MARVRSVYLGFLPFFMIEGTRTILGEYDIFGKENDIIEFKDEHGNVKRVVVDDIDWNVLTP